MSATELVSRRKRALPVLVAAAVVSASIGWVVYRSAAQARKDGALIAAVRAGDVGTVKALLREGARPGARETPRRDILTEAYAAVRRAIRGRPVPSEGTSALCLATEAGDSEVMAALLDAGANPNEPKQGPEAPLLTATIYRRADRPGAAVVSLLLARGADPNARSQQGNPALVQAALQRQMDLIPLLLSRGADPNALSNDGRTTLGIVCSRLYVPGSVEAAQALVDKRADVNSGFALEEAAVFCNRAVAQLLLQHGADPNAVSRNRHTPLTRAASGIRGRASAAQVDLIRLLLAHGADPTLRPPHTPSALDLSRRYGSNEASRLMQAEVAKRNGVPHAP